MGRGRVLLEPMEGGTEGAEVGREEVVVASAVGIHVKSLVNKKFSYLLSLFKKLFGTI